MVAIQFKLLGLIVLCTLASSTVIERRGSDNHLETVHKDDFEKRQSAPTATASVGSQGLSNDLGNNTVESRTSMVHLPRSTADTITKLGPGGLNYHRYLATDNDEGHPEDSLPGPIPSMNMTRNSEVKRRQISGVPYAQANGTEKSDNSTTI